MRFVRSTVAVLATAAALSSFASPAAAFTQRFDDLISHFVDCKILLLTDLEAHVRECGGGKKLSPSLNSLSEQAPGGAAPVVVTTPEGPSEPECPYEEGTYKYYCECYWNE
jgi:hypothetical protein